MRLETLSIQHVRRVSSAEIEPAAQNNFIYGANASGKTTILEAIHLLSGGRSFRTARARDIIQYEQEALTVGSRLFCDPYYHQIGIEKDRQKTRFRKDAETIRSASEVVKLLPMVVMNSDSFRLLEGGPSNRRELLDRLLFHVEPNYLSLIKTYYHQLKQRNAALRKNAPQAEIGGWDQQLVISGEAIDGLRTSRVGEINQNLLLLGLEKMTGLLEVHYESGWKKELSLHEALQRSLQRDRLSGTTAVGPHRGELRIFVQDRPARTMVSRGQGKLVVTALIVALSKILAGGGRNPPILLIDDLAAELDPATKSKAIQLLTGIKTQAFFTAIEYNTLPDLLAMQPKVFHVEHGVVTAQ